VKRCGKLIDTVILRREEYLREKAKEASGGGGKVGGC